MRCKGIFTDSITGKDFMLQGVEDLFEFREVVGEETEKKQATFLFVVKG